MSESRQETTLNWRAAAYVLREQNPELSNAEIGRLVGVTAPAVWKLFNPEKTRELRRIDNARRHQRKLEWQNAKDHSEEGRGRCECGSLRGAGAARRRDRRCEGCIHAIAEVRRTVAEGMWADGWTVYEMADVFGGVSTKYFHSQKPRGWNLPHRRTAEQVARMREARWAA
jgi:predicted transcriptional regulator